jgi:hypothetical protein
MTAGLTEGICWPVKKAVTIVIASMFKFIEDLEV